MITAGERFATEGQGNRCVPALPQVLIELFAQNRDVREELDSDVRGFFPGLRTCQLPLTACEGGGGD